MNKDQSPTWPHALKFAERMEARLAKNDRDEWLSCSYSTLFDLMDEEIRESENAFSYGTPEDIANECADIANFAMMIADKALTQI